MSAYFTMAKDGSLWPVPSHRPTHVAQEASTIIIDPLLAPGIESTLGLGRFF